jgi:hypothetical protein
VRGGGDFAADFVVPTRCYAEIGAKLDLLVISLTTLRLSLRVV